MDADYPNTGVNFACRSTALRVVAKRVEENPAFLPLFEHLIEEREAMIRKRKSLELVKQWAS